jgi:hypothetical protein
VSKILYNFSIALVDFLLQIKPQITPGFLSILEIPGIQSLKGIAKIQIGIGSR